MDPREFEGHVVQAMFVPSQVGVQPPMIELHYFDGKVIRIPALADIHRQPVLCGWCHRMIHSNVVTDYCSDTCRDQARGL